MDGLTSRPVRVLQMRRLMLRMLPLALLLLLVAGRIGMLEWNNRSGSGDYQGGEFAAAAGEFEDNRSLNPLQQWIATFNEGVSHHRDGDLETAITDYGVALGTVPTARECTVRINLALAHEARGDAFAESGDDASARTAWQTGRDVLAEGNCPSEAGQGEDEQERAGDVDQRLEDKLTEQDSTTPSPSSSPSPGDSPSTTPQEPSQEQLDELDELNREGTDNREGNEDLEDGGGFGDGGYHW